MTTLPHRKRRRESSREPNSSWNLSERENPPVSKRQRTSSRNWINGEELPTKKKGRHMTLTLPKSTPRLLSRMKINRPPERHLRLLERLSPPAEEGPREFETKSRSCWTRCREVEDLKQKTMSQRSPSIGFEKMKCLGMTQASIQIEGAVASEPVETCCDSVRTCQESNHSCELPMTYLRESLHPNG
jgi:hypothetical protein